MLCMFNQLYFKNMAKYILEFPDKKAFVKVSVSPMQIREVAGQYVDRQSDAFGRICLVREEDSADFNECTIIAVAVDELVGKPEFFVKEQSVNLANLEEVSK